MFKKIILITTILLSPFAIAGTASKSTTKQAQCTRDFEMCLYQSMQYRDLSVLRNLATPDFKKQIEIQKEQVEKLYQAVPTEDPLAVEVPLESPKSEGAPQKLYFYRYADFVVRLRVLYENDQPNAKISGVWVMRMYPNQQ